MNFKKEKRHGTDEPVAEKLKTSEDRNKRIRIIAIPWPKYSDALKNDNSSFEGGNLIVGNEFWRSSNFYDIKSKTLPDNIQNYLIIGHSQITKHGPRVRWKKYRLGDMALGYGGCYVSQKLSDNKFRIHTFGGREVSVDIRGQDVIIFFNT